VLSIGRIEAEVTRDLGNEEMAKDKATIKGSHGGGVDVALGAFQIDQGVGRGPTFNIKKVTVDGSAYFNSAGLGFGLVNGFPFKGGREGGELSFNRRGREEGEKEEEEKEGKESREH